MKLDQDDSFASSFEEPKNFELSTEFTTEESVVDAQGN